MPTMNLHEYAEFDAIGLAELIRNGDVTAAELAELALAGTEAVNSTLNAVVQTFPDRIEGLRFEYSPTGPFGGVPTMLKDLFHGEAGSACGNGSRLADGWVEPTDSEFPLRLRAAGLVNLGRTTVPEFGILGTTETLAQGATCTPWSTAHMSGGSSGGAAAAVAAGIVPVAAASDGGGSIRIPASACGVVGLKTSRGRVPWGPHISEALMGWAVHFLVSRTVRDTAALLDAVHGPLAGDPFDIAAPAVPYLPGLYEPTGRLRVAVCAEPFAGRAPDPQVVQATRSTADVLADLGHEVVEAAPAFPWEPFLQTMTDTWSATTAHTVDGFAAALGRPVDLSTVEAPTLEMVRYGRSVSGQQLLHGIGVINSVARVMGEFFGRFDLLLTPTLGALPAPLGGYDPHAAMPPRELFDSWSHLESFLPVFNATGQPAISLPLHLSAEGLPIGMQLVGRFGAEDLLLRVAAQLEQALPWAQRRPPVHVAS